MLAGFLELITMNIVILAAGQGKRMHSDLPKVLEGCGHLVAPNSSDAAAQVLAGIFADPEAARALGTRARERCIEKYGVETSRKALLELLEELK